jgi:drug/metabolite transporter (DMT)-like permease
MTIQNAAYVRALGQVELLFTFAAGYLFFRERFNALELIGIGLVASGIWLLLLYR